MTSTEQYNAPPSFGRPTASFGTHRGQDRPASAIRAGASSMPAAWQTRGMPTTMYQHQNGVPAKSIAEMALSPFKWVATTPLRMFVALAALGAAVTYLVF